MEKVDHKLVELFERLNIKSFIEAYAYLLKTTCYSDLESIINAIYYFPHNNINDYDIIVVKRFGLENNLFLYKLGDSSYLSNYFSFLVERYKITDNEEKGVIEELLNTIDNKLIINGILNVNLDFLLKDYRGFLLNDFKRGFLHNDGDDFIIEDITFDE